MYSLPFGQAPIASPAPKTSGLPAPSIVGALTSKAPPTIQASPSGVLGIPQAGRTLYFGQVYGTAPNGGLQACNIEIFSSTPNPIRGITYGSALDCSGGYIWGSGLTNLGKVAGTSLQPVQLAPTEYRVNQTSRAYDNFSYDRKADDELELSYMYFTLNLDGGGKWLTQPSAGGAASSIRCTPANESKLTCEIIVGPYPFVLDDNANCNSGSICEQARSATNTAIGVGQTATTTASKALADAQAKVGDYADDPTAEPALPKEVPPFLVPDVGGLPVDNEEPSGGIWATQEAATRLSAGKTTLAQEIATPSSPPIAAAGLPREAGACGVAVGLRTTTFGYDLNTFYGANIGCGNAKLRMSIGARLLRATSGEELDRAESKGYDTPVVRNVLETLRDYFVKDTSAQRRLYIKVRAFGDIFLPSNGVWLDGVGGCVVDKDNRSHLACPAVFTRKKRQRP